MSTLLIFLAVLGLLIFVHELGHFVTARRNGITCYEFGFGFPPRLIGVVKDENGKWKIVGRKDRAEYENTVYSLNWIPLGGFVRIKGEDGSDVSPDSFAVKSSWVRFKVLVAGVAMNVVLAWVLFSFAATQGIPEPVEDTPQADITVVAVTEQSAAELMGLKAGDVLKKACVGNDCQDFGTISDLQEFIKTNAGKEIVVSGLRQTKEFSVSGEIPATAPEDRGLLGVQLLPVGTVKYSVWEAPLVGARATFNALGMIFVGLGDLVERLFQGQKVSEAVSGPVGIAVMTGQYAEMGLGHLAQFTAILSANLAVINILPIPALDGGRILFLLIEVLRGGRKISQRLEGYIHGLSFLFLIGLMVLITVFDVLRFW